MPLIKQTYKIKAPIKRVWAALVDPKEISGWGAGSAKMSAKPNAKFSLWAGSIYGKNLEVVAEKKLKQQWFGGDWPKPSLVEIFLKERGGITEIRLIHKDLPRDELKAITQGWKDYYFGPMKEYLEKKKQ